VGNLSRFLDLKANLPNEVNLLAVSKGRDAYEIRSLAEFGQIHFGESRLQEALSKFKSLEDLNSLKWHFIGKLQSNKVRGVIRNFDFIHSIHSLELAQRVSRISGEENRAPKVMIQVKLRDDPTKSGFLEKDLLNDWSTLIDLPNINIIGLMTISPINLNSTDRKLLFKECRFLADRLGLLDCSMGMSGDWSEALDSGATWLRIGSYLFESLIN
tara:strand:- start:2993 stop:3634 length:642 start_codon:yes stop_codon:yes gene_type:complete